ncbi:MAG: Adenylate cyclase (EC, partial [uncultured Thiotrichaceae bacterium]
MLLSCQPQQNAKLTTDPIAQKGMIDLSHWNFSRGDRTLALNGEWAFYWQELLEPDDFPGTSAQPTFIQFPSPWNNHTVNSQPLGGDGYATYRLKVKLAPRAVKQRYAFRMRNMSSAYSLWVNNEHMVEVGKVGKTHDEMKPGYQPQIIHFTPDRPELAITLHVSNFHHRKGGAAWNDITMGTEKQIRTQQKSLDHFDLFILGSLMMMAFYHFGLFFLRRSDQSTLYFGLFCLIIGVRSLFYRDIPISMAIPDISWEAINKMRYLTTYVALPTFMMFVHNLYPQEFSKKVLYAINGLAALFIGMVIFTPVKVSSGTMMPYQIMTVLACLYTFYVLFRAAQQQRADVWWFIIGFISFFLAVLNDVLADQEIIDSILLIPFGLFLFIFSQAFILSRRFSRAFIRIEKLTQAYERFVPAEFLANLKQDDIVDVQLGDFTQQTMSVLFADIRTFASMSENMTPQETFTFLNAYLGRMEPAINDNNGFIDKYVGDEIMALFADNANDAVNAGLSMLNRLNEYNTERLNKGYSRVKIGIGINTGELMLGTIGARNRMEGTVISDAVNLASRIERLTRSYNTTFLISEHTLKALDKPEQYNIRFVDRVQVEGKKELVAIYEVFDGDC